MPALVSMPTLESTVAETFESLKNTRNANEP